jgi:hypothetical protein
VLPAEQLPTSDDFDSAGLVPRQPAVAAAAAAAVLSEVELHDWEGAGDDHSALLRGNNPQS